MNRNETLNIGSIIKNNTEEYLKYYLKSQFPSAVDGLKTVNRRVIYALKKVDSAIASANMIAKIYSYHQHSDNSLYETIMKMSQNFYIQIPLVKIIGNNGSYSNPSGFSAARYTKGLLSDFTKDVFIKDINFSTLWFEPTEDEEKLEPKYFIPKIPTSLLFNNNNVGYGITSRNISFSFENVCNLAINYVNNKNITPKLYKNMIPYFFGCSINNFREIYNKFRKNDFKEGSIKIQLESLIEAKNNVLVIKSIPPIIGIDSIKGKLIGLLKDKSSWFNNNVLNFDILSDRKSEFINMTIKFKRNTNMFKAIDKMSQLFYQTYYVYNNYEYGKSIITAGIDQLLEIWYNKRKKSIISDLKQKLIKIRERIFKIETYLLIKPHIDEIVNILRNNSKDDSIQKLHLNFNLTKKQCKLILKSELHTITRTTENELKTKLNELNILFKDVYNSCNNIDSIIINDVKYIKHKYSSSVSKLVPLIRNYKGLLCVNNGYVLVENKSDLNWKNIEWYINFNNDKCVIHNQIHKSVSMKNVETTYNRLPKYSIIPSVELYDSYKYTIYINDKCNTYIYNKIYTYYNVKQSKFAYLGHLTKDVVLITQDWNIVKMKLNDKQFENKDHILVQKSRCGFSFLNENITKENPYILIFRNSRADNLVLYKIYPWNVDTNIKFPEYGRYIFIDVIPNTRYNNNWYYINGKWYSINIDKKILESKNKIFYCKLSNFRMKL